MIDFVFANLIVRGGGRPMSVYRRANILVVHLLDNYPLDSIAHPAMVPVRNCRRCCRNARSCFNCRSTRDRRASDGPLRAKFHESSRLASTRLNSRALTDRVNSLRVERICDRVVLAPSAFDKSLSASKSSIRATSLAAYASWTSCQSEETVASPSARKSGCNRRTSRRYISFTRGSIVPGSGG